jgi:dTDP-4-amino-4,6-dideoxygalactose transaminase
MPVHLYGRPAEMEAILAIADRHGLAIIEDAAQSIGASYKGRPTGSFGTGCFSLYATKNITTGEGGMITTDDAGIAERLRRLRSHGSAVRYYHDELGYNYRMMDLQAAIGLAQLARLEPFTKVRIANAAYFQQHIDHPAIIKPAAPPHLRHAYHQYTVRVIGDRDDAIRQLAAAGVGCAIFYPLPIHQQKVYRDLGYCQQLPVAERAASEVLALPIHPALTDEEREQVVAAVNAIQVAEAAPAA